MGQKEFWGGVVSLLFHSIHIPTCDVSVYVIYFDVPRFYVYPFSNPFPSIRESVSPLSILYPILELPYIFSSIRVSVGSLPMEFPILEPTPYIILFSKI